MKKFVLFMVLVCLISLFPINGLALEEEKLIPNAVSGLLMDVDSGKIIFEKEVTKEVAVASMTKMMAQILILEKIEAGDIKLDDIVTVSKNAADMGGSQIYISEGEKISVEDLMKGISMASGNDATVAMAEYIAGSEAKFVKMMNKRAKDLGLKNTNFVNVHGLDEDGHYSSAKDMATIARELIVKHPEIFRFSSVYEDYLRENTKNKFWLVNTNKLVHFYEGADGLKTGSTDNAGYCLAATAKRGDLRLLAIVLGEKDATTRNTETMNLLDYGFSNVKVKKLKNKGDVVKKIRLDKANSEVVNVILKDDLLVTEMVDENIKDYKYSIDVDNFKLPVKKGDTVGKIKVLSKNKVVKESELTVSKNIKSLGYFELLINEIEDLILGEY